MYVASSCSPSARLPTQPDVRAVRKEFGRVAWRGVAWGRTNDSNRVFRLNDSTRLDSIRFDSKKWRNGETPKSGLTGLGKKSDRETEKRRVALARREAGVTIDVTMRWLNTSTRVRIPSSSSSSSRRMQKRRPIPLRKVTKHFNERVASRCGGFPYLAPFYVPTTYLRKYVRNIL